MVAFHALTYCLSLSVPDMTISGNLSSIYVTLDLAQFGLFMSMLGENLGEQFDQFERPSSVLVDPLQEVIATHHEHDFALSPSLCFFMRKMRPKLGKC